MTIEEFIEARVADELKRLRQEAQPYASGGDSENAYTDGVSRRQSWSFRDSWLYGREKAFANAIRGWEQMRRLASGELRPAVYIPHDDLVRQIAGIWEFDRDFNRQEWAL